MSFNRSIAPISSSGVAADRRRWAISSQSCCSRTINCRTRGSEAALERASQRPGQPFLGTGEAGQGPTAAAIANAVRDATGQRLRDLPLTAARVKAAVGV